MLARKPRDPSHLARLQSCVLYLLYFITVGDICNSWRDFGGLAAHVPHLSILQRVCVAGNAAFAFSCDIELVNRIKRLRRNRDSAVDFLRLFSGRGEDARRYAKSDLRKGVAVAGAVFDTHRNSNGKGKGAKSNANCNGKKKGYQQDGHLSTEHAKNIGGEEGEGELR